MDFLYMKLKKHSSTKRVDRQRRNFLKTALTATSVGVLAGLGLPGRVFATPESAVERDLYAPQGLALSPDNLLYVADAGNYCVRIFDSNGKIRGSIGSPGTGKGELNFPTDVAIWKDELFVVDTNNGRVCLFQRSTGSFLRRFGSLGGTPDRMFTPGGIALTDSIAYVANTRGHCCQFWQRSDDRAIGLIGILGDEPEQPFAGDRDIRLRLPTAVCVDPTRKSIFVADSKHARVVVTDLSGGYQGSIDAAQTGKKLSRPQDMCISNNELFIADTGNRRVVRMDLTTQKIRVLEGNWNEPVGIDVHDNLLALSDWSSDPAKRKVLTVRLPG